MKDYHKKLLAQILAGDQPLLEDVIDSRLDEGLEFEGETFYSLESMRIWQVVEFLKESYEEIKELII